MRLRRTNLPKPAAASTQAGLFIHGFDEKKNAVFSLMGSKRKV